MMISRRQFVRTTAACGAAALGNAAATGSANPLQSSAVSLNDGLPGGRRFQLFESCQLAI